MKLRRSLPLSVLLLLFVGCASRRGAVAAAPHCSMESAAPWISPWFSAWELMARQMRLPEAPAPGLVFYDDTCVYTTIEGVAPRASVVPGPSLLGVRLPWRVEPHGGSLALPEAPGTPVALMSFANATEATGPFFVMAAPSFWEGQGLQDPFAFTGVFLHEFAHTRQVRGMGKAIGPIDAAWPYPEELTDDAVQKHFEADPEYVTAYLVERDLLYRAAEAPSIDEARRLASEALMMMRARQARWFVDDEAMFVRIDDVFLAMEAVGQWTGYAWLSHPQGGGLDRDAAIAKMLGRRKWWTQDEGLALLLVVDRLLPDWPALAFGDEAIGATELLERAVKSQD